MDYPILKIECPQAEIIHSILAAVVEIAAELQKSPVVTLKSMNKFGYHQLQQDVFSDNIIQKYLRKNSLVRGFASQERPEFQKCGNGEYVVTYDPLDGSSIIDANFSVGSIFSIWHTDKDLIGQKISKQTNAILSVYGPRTTAIIYNSKENKVQEITYYDEKWIISHDHLLIRPSTKIFSPGNLGNINENMNYYSIVLEWMKKGLTLRYTGGLVPDVSQIFIKGHGIFTNIATKGHNQNSKVLYQAAAVGFLIQKAGGSSFTEGYNSLMDYQISSYHDKISIAVGSREEVDNIRKNLCK